MNRARGVTRSSLSYALVGLIVVVSEPLTAADSEFRNVPLSRCEFRLVIDLLHLQTSERAAAIATQTLRTLKEMESVAGKATIQNRSIGEQLSKEDVARFSEIRQRLMAMNLASLIESRRERDLRVIWKLVQIADKNYRWQEEAQEGDPEEFLQSTIYLWRFMGEKDDMQPELTDPHPYCSLDTALHSIEAETLEKLPSTSIAEAEKVLNKLVAKYGKPLDAARGKMSKADRKQFDEMMAVLRPALRGQQFIYDIENIRTMARASDIVYEADRRDVAFSGGDISAIGTTISERAKANSYDERTGFAIGLWRKINEKIPAPVTKEWEEIGKAMKGVERVK